MKKFILLFISIIFMTGCSATVNVNIEKDKVTEDYTIVGNSSDYGEIKEIAKIPTPLFYDANLENPYILEKQSGVDYYNVTMDDVNKKVSIKGEFPLKDHVKSSLVKLCFQYYNIVDGNTSEELAFYTSDGVICEYNNFVLNVKTPYKVTFNNADSVDEENNIYTWNVNDKNYSEKRIALMIDFSQKYDDSESNIQDNDDVIEKDVSNDNFNNNDSFNNSVILIIVVSILFVLGIVIIILKNKKNKISSLED